MKINIKATIVYLSLLALAAACNEEHQHDEEDEHVHEQEAAAHDDHEGEAESVNFSAAQFEAMEIEVDTLSLRNVSTVVQANGQIEVPPQNEATVTAIMGANISSINVIEGEDVKKGQALAYLRHPNLTKLQGDYLELWNNLGYLEKNYQRQKKLYEAEVGSGKTMQQTEAEYSSTKGMVKSLESQLRQFGMNPERIKEGNFYSQVPVVSPIEGTIVNVNVKTGQYVQAEKNLFEVVNTHHIHADLMVFERDVHKVKKGQKVRFSVESMQDKELFAEIYSVGKKFEQDPKAVHVHAEIENKTGNLIPGMYIKGEILTDSTYAFALPEEAVIREADKHYAFTAEKVRQEEGENWIFKPMELIKGNTNNDWISVKFLKEIPQGTLFAMNNAYYIMAEMKKGESEHSH